MISFEPTWRNQFTDRWHLAIDQLKHEARTAQSDEGRLVLGNRILIWTQGIFSALVLLAGLFTHFHAALLGATSLSVLWLINRIGKPSEHSHRAIVIGTAIGTSLVYSLSIHPALGIGTLCIALSASVIYQRPKQTLLFGTVGLALLSVETALANPSELVVWLLLTGFVWVLACGLIAWLYQQAQIGLGHDMQFVLANINMLAADLSELNDLASQLGRDNSFRVNEGLQTAQGLQAFIQSLKLQTTQSQQAADQSSQLTQDCFDLINELNQSLDLLTRMGKQSHEANRDIQFFAKQADQSIPEATRHGLMAVAASLEHLNERMQAYMAKIDVMKRGLNALENQAVSLDRSTHHWIEQGHNNQKQGWELLSNIEQLQTGAEDAYATLGSSVKTVLRVNKLIEDLDRRLQHIKV